MDKFGPTEARREIWIPWNWIHRHVSVHVCPEN